MQPHLHINFSGLKIDENGELFVNLADFKNNNDTSNLTKNGQYQGRETYTLVLQKPKDTLQTLKDSNT